MKKPNIVYFVADQMRSDSLHHLGCEASITPNLDHLAQIGVSFKNAYCQNPVCVPSRCSFLTGLYPHTTGHRTIHYLQNEGEPNFLRTMKNNGYEVIWIGRNDIIPAHLVKTEFCDHYYNGFFEGDSKEYISQNRPQPHATKNNDTPPQNDISKPGYYAHFRGKISEEQAHQKGSDWHLIDAALNYIDKKSKDPSQKPFFLYITLGYPHPPYACEDPWFSMIDRKLCTPRRPDALSLDKPSMLKSISKKQNLQNWGDENFIEMRATYLAMVSRFDYQFGLIQNKLKETHLYDNTSIFVFSDHGDYTGDYNIAEKVQNCFEDCITNVPLIIKPAEQFSVKPRISNALVELVDLCSTVEQMCDITPEYVHFGKSLVDCLKGNENHHDAIFCEGGRIHNEYWAMERGHNQDSEYWPRLDTQCSEGPEHTKAVMIRMKNYKYVYRLYEKDEFYNLENDPLELCNEIDNPQYQSIIIEMKMRMLTWFVETGDIVPNRKDPRF